MAAQGRTSMYQEVWTIQEGRSRMSKDPADIGLQQGCEVSVQEARRRFDLLLIAFPTCNLELAPASSQLCTSRSRLVESQLNPVSNSRANWNQKTSSYAAVVLHPHLPNCTSIG